ncbi:uncharacterized protein LOC126797178 [Argentina anserina]|uniref:uncharacterized protein LOC126797178 n=1 Tax=Argentina anserina TaxID=57926 RepID=UPI00217687E0|nr:uncharacterized protein LOC126797178 [Potentilla anserina]
MQSRVASPRSKTPIGRHSDTVNCRAPVQLKLIRESIALGTDLTRLISGNPKFLTLSLENNLRPCYDIIKALPIPDTMAGLVLSKLFQGFTVSPQVLSNIAPNIAFLKAVQVPETSVNLCLSINLYAVSRETDKFKENVENVISMGIRPSAPTFMKALYVMSVLDELKWVQRVEIYKTAFNWTEDEFFLAFRRYPMFMSLSEKNVFNKMDFLVNSMCWKSGSVAGYPHVLTYSLEKWIIPRYLVLRVLLLKGLMTKEVFSLPGTLSSSKIFFLEKFVIKYQKQVPELLDIFQGKMSLADLGLETGGAT